MGKTFETISDDIRKFIEGQKLFFVASAPLEESGRVNLSPKGHDSFRVIDERTCAYLDLTGSGVETIAHLKQNGRITVMFCAFEGPPRILRLYGTGRVCEKGTPAFDEQSGLFPDYQAARAIIIVDIALVKTSCGFAVPLYDYAGDRDTLLQWSEKRGESGMVEYRRERNATSMDGLTGFDGD